MERYEEVAKLCEKAVHEHKVGNLRLSLTLYYEAIQVSSLSLSLFLFPLIFLLNNKQIIIKALLDLADG